MSETVGFTIGPMRADEYERCIDIACAAFATNNPGFKALQIPHSAYREFIKADISREAAVDTGLSLVARGEDGTPLAFLFLKTLDLTDSPPDDVFKLHGGLECLKEMIEGLYVEAMTSPWSGLCLASIVQGKALHAAMGGTFPDANGKGLGKALRVRATEVAKERGFNTLIVEPGHGATRHIWTEHCHGVIRAERPLDTFRSKSGVRGERPTRGVEGTVSLCEVVLRKRFSDSTFCRPFFLAKLLWQLARRTSR